MRPDDLALLSVPSSPTMHGDLLLVAVSSPDPVKNEYRGGLARIPLVGGDSPQRWSWDRQDSAPVLSPDGRWLAFLRVVSPEGEPTRRARPQVHVQSVAGGDARRLTDLSGGAAGALVWAPDSCRLAFTSRTPTRGRYGTVDEEWSEAPNAAAEAPRRITRLDYRRDAIGYLADQHSRLYVQDMPGVGDTVAEPVELTDGRCEVWDPAWSPDGAHIIFLAPRDFGVRETVHDHVYAVPAAGGDPVLVVSTTGFADGVAVGDSGDIVFFCSVNDAEGRRREVTNCGLWTAPFRLDGPVAARRLTDLETVDCEFAVRPVIIGDAVLAAVRNRGAVELRQISLAGDEIPLADLPLLLGDRAQVKGFTADTDRIAAIVSTPDSPGEVVLRADGVVTTLTDLAAPLRAAGVRPVRELTGTGSDGYPVHGWLVLPEGPGPHPVVLRVHGGPFGYDGWGFFDEAQMYASAGYAVVLSNPRGSAGYGLAHARSIAHAMGTLDADDVLALLDVALALPECDAEQVGLMGASYGGFMTGWLAAHHGERFRAAWSQSAVNAWDSYSGTSDIGYLFTDLYIGGEPDEQRRRSPLTYADQIQIPFAVVHSENDLRCPLEQAQRMFVALRRNGTEAEMLLFPGESHLLAVTGKPRHRVQRFRAVLDWWSRHLQAHAVRR